MTASWCEPKIRPVDGLSSVRNAERGRAASSVGSAGRLLARTCARLWRAEPSDVKFCGECGSSLLDWGPSATELAQRLPAGTERRLVSVLFVDLVGFTTLSEQRDAEDVRALLDTYFETARTVIERHGGAVEKFIGDAVMAVWGTPVAHEDDAERAVRAALELVDAVEALGEVGRRRPSRRGAASSPARPRPCRAPCTRAWSPATWSTRPLVCSPPPSPAAVYVGEATFRAASRAIAFEEVGALAVKGKEPTVHAWRALRVVAERGGANRMAIEPPFVGRDGGAPPAEGHAPRDRPRRQGAGRVGHPGSAASASRVWRGSWRSTPTGSPRPSGGTTVDAPPTATASPSGRSGEMVRMRAQIAEGDAPLEARAKLAASVAQHVPDPDERAWVEPRLAFLLALEERPPGGGEELFAAWRTFFERISAAGTVVMVFEDLQWADPGLLDFVGFHARVVADPPDVGADAVASRAR